MQEEEEEEALHVLPVPQSKPREHPGATAEHGPAETLTNQPDPRLFSWKDMGWGCVCAHTATSRGFWERHVAGCAGRAEAGAGPLVKGMLNPVSGCTRLTVPMRDHPGDRQVGAGDDGGWR